MKKLLFTTITIISCTVSFAQNIWIGGAPGQETSWMEAHNWSTGAVPDMQDEVLIPYLWHGYYPEVSSVAPTIGRLEVEDGAFLMIARSGVLIIDGSYKNGSGLMLAGNIHNEGALIITETAGPAIEGDMDKLDNYGVCSQVTDAGHVTLANALPIPKDDGHSLANAN